MLRHYDDSKQYLLQHTELVCEDTANYLVVWCIDLQIEQASLCFYLISDSYFMRCDTQKPKKA
jgi:hypothetical protein